MRYLVITLCLTGLLPGVLANPAYGVQHEKTPWGTIVVGEQTDAERMATVDLQRYLGQVTGHVPVLVPLEQWVKRPAPAVVLGPYEKDARDKGGSPGLGEEGYRLDKASYKGKEIITIIGNASAGIVNGVYGLLRELGFGFYLGSEAIPASLPPTLPNPVTRVPTLKVRGVLPWYNFFDSPTTWDPVDHRAFVDQLIRMGANFVGFHTYDSEPFAAVPSFPNGNLGTRSMEWGARLLSTASPTWGTRPLATTQFPFGIDKLFPFEYFGAETTRMTYDASVVIQREQDVMRDALDYASRRGLHTCIGFEITGAPTDTKTREIFLKRFNHLLDQYPAADMIWLWQSETQGATGFKADRSPLAVYGAARRDTFERIVERDKGERPFFQDTPAGKTARAMEGARLEQYAQLALHALAHRQHAPRLIISGWGGEDRILSAEYYDGLDKLLPENVIFSSLDFINIRENVDSIYNELPETRERWPILWLECDGDQWHAQPYVHTLEQTMQNLQKGGSQGALGIHWRTRDIEENLGYIVDSAWIPNLTAEWWFQDMAWRCYGPAIAADMAKIHSELDSLGYRWVGGGGQSECGNFTWGAGDADKHKKLAELRARAAALLPQAGRAAPRVQWLINYMDWVLGYDDTENAVKQATALLSKVEAATDLNEKKTLAVQALQLLDDKRFADALHAYARRVTTRGEYGVLATVNTKAVVAWNELKERLEKMAGTKQAQGLPAWAPEPEIILPRLVGSTPANADLELMPVVLGGKPAWAHFRPLGARKWKTQPLGVVRGWVDRVVVPAELVKSPALEIGFSFDKNPAAPMAFGPICVTVQTIPKAHEMPRPSVPVSTTAFIKLTIKAGERVPVEATWDNVPDADFYRAYRNDKPVVDTAAAYFPDVPMQLENAYRVEAIRDGKVIAKSEPVNFKCEDMPAPEQVELSMDTNRLGVLLHWPQNHSLYAASYQIDRRTSGKAVAHHWDHVAQVSATTAESIYRDTPPPGLWEYRLTPVNAAGTEGPPSVATASFPPKLDGKPVLDLPLTSKPEGCQVNGAVTLGPDGANFAGGYLTFPYKPWMDLGTGLTLDFEFRLDRMTEMPVLLCHGVWQGDGWFAQILGGELIVRMPSGDAKGPKIEPGKWYKVRFVFDGMFAHLAIDGKWLEQPKQTLRPVAASRNLIIGNYEANGAGFSFLGTMRNVRLYNDVLLN